MKIVNNYTHPCQQFIRVWMRKWNLISFVFIKLSPKQDITLLTTSSITRGIFFKKIPSKKLEHYIHKVSVWHDLPLILLFRASLLLTIWPNLGLELEVSPTSKLFDIGVLDKDPTSITSLVVGSISFLCFFTGAIAFWIWFHFGQPIHISQCFA